VVALSPCTTVVVTDARACLVLYTPPTAAWCTVVLPATIQDYTTTCRHRMWNSCDVYRLMARLRNTTGVNWRLPALFVVWPICLCNSKSPAAQAQLAAAVRRQQQHRVHGILGSASQHKAAASLHSAVSTHALPQCRGVYACSLASPSRCTLLPWTTWAVLLC
jgi:hypothetical protein